MGRLLGPWGRLGAPAWGAPFPGPHPTDNLLLLSPADDGSLAEEKGLRCQNPDCMDKGRAAKVGTSGLRGLTALSIKARISTGPAKVQLAQPQCRLGSGVDRAPGWLGSEAEGQPLALSGAEKWGDLCKGRGRRDVPKPFSALQSLQQP